MKPFFPTLVALAAAATLASFAPLAQAHELRSADVHNSDDYPTVAAVRYMSDIIKKESGGRRPEHRPRISGSRSEPFSGLAPPSTATRIVASARAGASDSSAPST